MNNMLNDLNKYFENTPIEQIMKDWDETKEFDKIGPTINSFLFQILETKFEINNIIIDNINPKYTSGFFILKKLNLI